MVPSENKAKRLSSVNHTTKTIHHHHHYHMYICVCAHPCRWIRTYSHIDGMEKQQKIFERNKNFG